MTIFKTSPEKALQRDIDAATANRIKLSARLAASDASVIEATTAAQQLAIIGADDRQLEAAESKARALRDRAITLRSAIEKNETDLAALERGRADLADKKLRQETATEIAALAVDLEEIAKVLDPILERMADVAGRATPYKLFVEQALISFAVSSRTQIPDATALLASVLRTHAAAVLGGSKAVPKPVPPVLAVVAPAAVPRADHFSYSESSGHPVSTYRVSGGFVKEQS
jgi:hypothetical protein